MLLQALPAPPPGHMAIRSKEGCNLIFSGTSGPPITSVPNQNSELVLTPNVPDITVVSPEDEHLKHIIDTMALNVLDGGCAFEQAIMERGRGNPLFNFLFELGSKEHTYYVWRLYSFAQGDTLQRWRTEPYIMIAGSGRWIPPPLPATRSTEHGKESTCTYAAGKSRSMEAEQTLTDSQRDEFENMLRALTLERSQIKEAMGFALDNADAAGEVVDVLTESLTLKETSIPTKVARLMLVSDILHNSSARVKNASAYRTEFEATLPDIIRLFVSSPQVPAVAADASIIVRLVAAATCGITQRQTQQSLFPDDFELLIRSCSPKISSLFPEDYHPLVSIRSTCQN